MPSGLLTFLGAVNFHPSRGIARSTVLIYPLDPGFPQGSYGLQGYIAHKKQPPPRTYIRTMSRAIWWPYGGGGVSYERGTPVP